MVHSSVLTQMSAKNLPAGKFADGQGLWLIKRSKAAGKWIVRLVVGGRRREMGLGRWPDVSIAEARDRAAEARKTLRNGLDPIIERDKLRRSLDQLTVEQAINGCFSARKAELKGDGEAGGWMSPLRVHVIPKIGRNPIEQVDQHILKQVLEPIWHEKADTARKALNRINLTLKHAAALGLDVDLQAGMKTRALLGKQKHTAKHVEAMPYRDVPSFYSTLSKRPGMAALSLRLLILTGVRSAGIRLLTLDEIQGDLWMIPAERNKTDQELRVPLSDEARNIVGLAHSAERKFVFSNRADRSLSNMAMSKLMTDMKVAARPHGFRSSLRTWMEDHTDASFEVKETMIGHKVGNRVVQAYQRSDHLEKRKVIMAEWSSYVTGQI